MFADICIENDSTKDQLDACFLKMLSLFNIMIVHYVYITVWTQTTERVIKKQGAMRKTKDESRTDE